MSGHSYTFCAFPTLYFSIIKALFCPFIWCNFHGIFDVLFLAGDFPFFPVTDVILSPNTLLNNHWIVASPWYHSLEFYYVPQSPLGDLLRMSTL